MNGRVAKGTPLSGSGSILASTLGALTTVGGLCHAAEHPVRYTAWSAFVRSVAFCILLVVSQASSAQPLDDDKVDAPPQVWTEVQLAAKSLGSTEDSVRTRMGAPTSRAVQSKPNRHDAASTDSLISLSYPGLEIEILEALTGQPHSRQFLLSVVLKANDKRLPARFSLGTPQADVIGTFGPPVSEEGATLSYHYYDPGIVSWAGVAYSFSDGRLQSTKWWYEVH